MKAESSNGLKHEDAQTAPDLLNLSERMSQPGPHPLPIVIAGEYDAKAKSESTQAPLQNQEAAPDHPARQQPSAPTTPDTAIQDLSRRVDELQARLAQVQRGQQDQAVALHNFRAAIFNRIPDFLGYPKLVKPQKKTPGLGAPLPHGAHWESLPRLEVGECPPDEYLPTMKFGVLQMTYEEINQLSMIMNDTFGIDAQDELDSCQFKVLEWARTL